MLQARLNRWTARLVLRSRWWWPIEANLSRRFFDERLDVRFVTCEGLQTGSDHGTTTVRVEAQPLAPGPGSGAGVEVTKVVYAKIRPGEGIRPLPLRPDERPEQRQATAMAFVDGANDDDVVELQAW